jgi:ATP-dependent DNA helicase RecQ
MPLIVSPLLALMRNQIQAANRLGIRPLTINSTNRNEWPALQQVVRANEAGVSPIVAAEFLSCVGFMR